MTDAPPTDLVDLQVNGYAGVDFNRDGLTADDLHAACERLAGDGVVGFLPTIITDTLPAMTGRLRRIAELRHGDPLARRMVRGLHVEGPFLNPTPGYIGAHPAEHARSADVDAMDRLLDAAGGLVRVVTLAPECDPGLRVTRRLADAGVVVSAGHCDPSPDQLDAACDAGLSLFTHLGNGCPAMLPRHENVIQRVLSRGHRLTVTVIADGVHVPPPALTNYVRLLGVDRCVVVSDAVTAAGLGPGRFTLGRWELEVGARPRLPLARRHPPRRLRLPPAGRVGPAANAVRLHRTRGDGDVPRKSVPGAAVGTGFQPVPASAASGLRRTGFQPVRCRLEAGTPITPPAVRLGKSRYVAGGAGTLARMSDRPATIPDRPAQFARAGSDGTGSNGAGPTAGNRRPPWADAEAMLDEAAALAAADLPPETFAAAFLNRLVRGTGAAGALLWDRTGEGGRTTLTPSAAEGLTAEEIAGEDPAAHAKLLAEAADGPPRLVNPHAGGRGGAGNPGDRALALCPDGAGGVLEAAFDPRVLASGGTGGKRIVLEAVRSFAEVFEESRTRHEVRQLRAELGRRPAAGRVRRGRARRPRAGGDLRGGRPRRADGRRCRPARRRRAGQGAVRRGAAGAGGERVGPVRPPGRQRAVAGAHRQGRRAGLPPHRPRPVHRPRRGRRAA